MDRYVFNVSILKPAGTLNALAYLRFQEVVIRSSILLGKALSKLPLANPHTDFLAYVYKVFEEKSICEINGQRFLRILLSEEEGRKVLASIGIGSIYSLSPVHELTGGIYVLSYCYHSKFSDGEEEFQFFKQSVDSYFQSAVPKHVSTF